MLIDWIALGLFAVAVITCGVIVWRKLPQLASIRIDAIPKHQQDARKQEILDKRLQQKLGKFETSLVNAMKYTVRGFGRVASSLIYRLRTLEREYRKRVVQQQAIADPDALRARMATTLAAGQAALVAGDLERAEQCFVDMVSMDPKSIDAYLGLADVASERKDYVNAREALQFVLKLQQDNDAAYTRLGRVATSEGKLDEAEADYLKSVSLNATAASTQVELADLEEKLGHLDRAEAAYAEAVRLEPANPKYLDAFLTFAITHKRKSIAENALEKLRETNPENQKLDELAQQVKAL